MFTKNLILLYLFLAPAFICVKSQTTSHPIQKIDAFFYERFAGNLLVDSNGTPQSHGPDTIFNIYVEVNDVSLRWEGAWRNGSSYSIIPTKLNDAVALVGVSELTGRKILLHPLRKNKLWLLELVSDVSKNGPPIKAKPNEIILKARRGKITIIKRITRQTKLVSLPSP